jgi:hypothetical protein
VVNPNQLHFEYGADRFTVLADILPSKTGINFKTYHQSDIAKPKIAKRIKPLDFYGDKGLVLNYRRCKLQGR